MRVLVTGGAGFIGSHTCESLLEKGHEVVCLDNLDPYYDVSIKKRNLDLLESHDRFEFVEGDVRNAELVSKLVRGVDAVNHQAAQAGVRISVENPMKPHSVNTEGTLNLLEAARENNVKHFLFSSSSSVYGGAPNLPFEENAVKIPVSPYGVSKLAAENYVRIYNELHELPTVSLRYFTVYGPRMRPDLAISIFTERALKGKEIEIFGDGKQTRDFTYINDIVRAQNECLEKGMGDGKAYNVGSGERVTVNELAEKIIEQVDSGSGLKHTDPRKGDARHTWADTSKAEEKLGWKPRYGLEEGLEKFIDWYREERL
ncbi:UDP-glucose 4-epimerase [candidate division MSBL1 archaeon SCGC-AAA259I09]|uniref:UDP-glucose 4-epimerase n=1 Tax=candidate division MSBL1 archaeon SCGC-AAA259I09 TaxID=1698267 RepID=A0A133US96_9EURY|nr:UDP-glucose 4-epimerase [candidate division MSBL1 archaeon SCGC-AAA259I09]